MTTTPDFRALCKELVKKLDELNCNFDIPSQSALIECVLDALATPAPEPPTDGEIEEWADAATEVPLEAMDPDIHGWQRCFTKEEFCASIRAALERWGK
jgi:hypothetical protein